jgi:hypothetical protein
MKSWLFSTLILIGFLSPNAHAAVPTSAQMNMSKHIQTAIEWTNHLRDEVNKRSNAKEIEGDLAGIMSFLSAMNSTAEQIVLESPSEKSEGHFIEMRKFQEAASLVTKDFPVAKSGKNPNFSKMKTATKKILANLEDAKHWHELELSEIEKNPKD